MFDVMVKRLHEYKRQLLNVAARGHPLPAPQGRPGGPVRPPHRALRGQGRARLPHGQADHQADQRCRRVVNGDPLTSPAGSRWSSSRTSTSPWRSGSTPAADLSEQISLAGMEASGTGNMKFALNGAVTIGTLDGANIEIRDLVGAENFFLFGLTTEEVAALAPPATNPATYYEADAELRRALDAIAGGAFSGRSAAASLPLVDSLLHDDRYMLLADYRPYVDRQDGRARGLPRRRALDADVHPQRRPLRLLLLRPRYPASTVRTSGASAGRFAGGGGTWAGNRRTSSRPQSVLPAGPAAAPGRSHAIGTAIERANSGG